MFVSMLYTARDNSTHHVFTLAPNYTAPTISMWLPQRHNIGAPCCHKMHMREGSRNVVYHATSIYCKAPLPRSKHGITGMAGSPAVTASVQVHHSTSERHHAPRRVLGLPPAMQMWAGDTWKRDVVYNEQKGLTFKPGIALWAIGPLPFADSGYNHPVIVYERTTPRPVRYLIRRGLVTSGCQNSYYPELESPDTRYTKSGEGEHVGLGETSDVTAQLVARRPNNIRSGGEALHVINSVFMQSLACSAICIARSYEDSGREKSWVPLTNMSRCKLQRSHQLVGLVKEDLANDIHTPLRNSGGMLSNLGELRGPSLPGAFLLAAMLSMVMPAWGDVE
ncbi:hypothetical protein DFJ77DRAFT_439222 [Powellomyces hirtus]|nr:hypothetical protein DFJ77DRAFT_439222 [Powellomyces hirtus]